MALDKQVKQLVDLVVDALDELKAKDMEVLDVRSMTNITDVMIIASGTSRRHVKSISESVVEMAKKSGNRPIGTEGEEEGDWILVDLGDVIVHVMMPSAREFYSLEKLWSVIERDRQSTAEDSVS